MLYSEFRAQVRRQLEEPTSGVWSDSSILYWTNEEADRIARRTKCLRDEQYTDTLVSQWSYSLPAETLEVIDMFVDGYAITRIDYHDFSILDQSITGKPDTYAITQGEMVLYPTPDATYPVRFFRFCTPDDIDADDDLIPFDGGYVTALEYAVLSRAFEQIGDWASSDAYRARYENIIGELAAQKGAERQVQRASTPREVY